MFFYLSSSLMRLTFDWPLRVAALVVLFVLSIVSSSYGFQASRSQPKPLSQSQSQSLNASGFDAAEQAVASAQSVQPSAPSSAQSSLQKAAQQTAQQSNPTNPKAIKAKSRAQSPEPFAARATVIDPSQQSQAATSRAKTRGNGIPVRGEQRIDELSVSVSQESYLNPKTVRLGSGAFTQAELRLRAQVDSPPSSGALGGAIDLGGSFATDVENYTMLEVPEAYLSWAGRFSRTGSPWPDRAQVILGRHRENWSLLDSEWMTGMIQPLNRFDSLRPTEQGLTGVFLGIGRGKFELLTYTSSIFIPEQGAPFQLENGKFISNSPWFQGPPDSLILFDRMTRVDYKVEVGPVGSIINHPSLGMIFRYGSPENLGFMAQLSLARKPRNILSLPFKGQLFLTDTSSYGDVSVYPRVAYHNVGAIDLGWRGSRLGFGLSGLVEAVSKEEIPEDLTHQIFEPLALVSPSLEYHFASSRSWGPRVRVSYLNSSGGGVRSEGPLGANGNVFGARTPYREAMQVSSRALLINRAKWKLEHSLRWLEEFSEQGTVVMTDFRFLIGESWRVVLSGDVIGSRKPVDQSDTFISRFRGNDRLSGKLTYIF